jgi:uncharacterized protein (TIGR03435 family)
MRTLPDLLILTLPFLYAQDLPPNMPIAAKPAFEVSTIKPASPDRGFSIKASGSGLVNTTSTSLFDLIKFAYDLHPSQIVGAPGWLEDEKFDISAKPDTLGKPSTLQMKAMMQGLFADRFHLAFHREKKEMAAYVITEAKSGAKLEKNNSDPNGLMSFSGGGQQGMTVRNMTMPEFAFTMQAGFLDGPVVDRTGFGNQRYNFVLKWTPDSGTAGADTPNSPDPPPDIFVAVQEQLGLKLQSTKAPVDVMVVDRVEKPGEN